MLFEDDCKASAQNETLVKGVDTSMFSNLILLANSD